MLNSFTLATTGGIHWKDGGKDHRMQGEIQHWYGFHFLTPRASQSLWKEGRMVGLYYTVTNMCNQIQGSHIQRIFPMSSPETTEHQVITLSQQTHKELLLGVQNPASTE